MKQIIVKEEARLDQPSSAVTEVGLELTQKFTQIYILDMI